MSTQQVHRLREAIEAAAGPQAVADADTAWRRLADSDALRVVFVGPWSAGKSSLIKRLLVEDGTAIPDWLTISASRETYQIREARSTRFTYVDTPGLGSDERKHDLMALSSVAATDLLVVAVTPQLLGSDVDRLAALVNGTAISPHGGRFFPPGALIVVISKADMAGVDPIDDLDGFRAIVDRKRASVVTALERHLHGELPPIIAVVADLGGQYARNPRPNPAAFAEGAEWDGVAQLRDLLGGSADQVQRLRSAAQVRHWARAGATALEQATAALSEAEAAVRRVDADRSRVLVLEEELAAVDASAASRLRDDIRDEMHSVIMQGKTDSAEQLAEQISEQLNATVGAWHAESTSKLVALARRAQIELHPPAIGAGDTSAHIEQLVRHATAADSSSPEVMLTDFVAKGLLLADKMQELRLGIKAADVPEHLSQYQSLVDRVHPDVYARTLTLLNIEGVLTDPSYAQELTNLQRHDGVSDLISYLRKPGGISSPGHAERLKNTTNTLRIAADAAPVLLELLRMQQQEKASLHQRERRAHLQVQADGAATRLAEQILAGDQSSAGWRGQVAELRTAIRSSAPGDDAVALAAQQGRALAAARDQLDAVLRDLAAAAIDG
ncbi:hypothetical protein F4553_001168 [Allocatelliglobosispora scoriae]|uniref:G domain-containing protein n=1 Tax=Allocatelliglobosispora scoriae TaxID=643052 RepID=A0A841BKR5_9ACTN|nr:GTPase domain-containing protein [Allocatelliglobosispora scoriae]MBB5867789.1 hypothetical protein [Allocatelliglobosispora scoriae]